MKTNTHKRLQAGLHFLKKSIAATGHKGSAAYYQLGKGWSAAYPETTGYLIETLFRLAAALEDEEAHELALGCAHWLLSLQHPDGSFPSGVGGRGAPVIFDTGQILFGLSAAYRQRQDSKYVEALRRAARWLLQHWDAATGTWPDFHYHPGFAPTYYTRVIWALLEANTILEQQDLREKMGQALSRHVDRLSGDPAAYDWGFGPGEPALTHTIAYTVRGLLESGLLAAHEAAVERARSLAAALQQSYLGKGRLAATYTGHWHGDYRYRCVTGNAQLSILYRRLYQEFGETQYAETAQLLLQEVLISQCLLPASPMYGGVPGSWPIWGPYQRFRWTNWGAKFFLDALSEQ